jgi:hypothetical protein
MVPVAPSVMTCMGTCSGLYPTCKSASLRASCCRTALFAFVCVPAVLHFHYMNLAAIELLDSIPLTALSFCGYQDIGAVPVPLVSILGSAKWGVIHPLSEWYPAGAQLCCMPFGQAIIRVCGVWYAAGVGLIFL